MTFEYRTYFIFLFLLPALVLVLTSPVVYKAIQLLIRIVREGEYAGNSQKIIFATLVAAVCIIPQVIYMVNGGFFLITERSGDAVAVSGVVESIAEPSGRFPGLRAGSKQGADVVIDGQQYFMLTAESLEVGDELSVSYLPKSRVVLEYRQLGE